MSIQVSASNSQTESLTKGAQYPETQEFIDSLIWVDNSKGIGTIIDDPEGYNKHHYFDHDGNYYFGDDIYGIGLARLVEKDTN